MKDLRLSASKRYADKNRWWAFVGASVLFIGALGGALALIASMEQSEVIRWTPEEVSLLSSLRLPDGGIPISDESNQWLQHPEAIELGRKLFFDEQFSRNGKVACSTCHQPEHFFTDGKQFSHGVEGETKRHTPTLVGAAAFRWQFWDGRSDSLWAQALDPLEQAHEHGLDRVAIVRRFIQSYGSDYIDLFGHHFDHQALSRFPDHASPKSSIPSEQKAWEALPPVDQQAINRVFANLGKSLAAFQATLMPKESRFDRFVMQLEQARIAGAALAVENAWLTLPEQAGLKLFMSEKKGQCLRCHNGPLLTNGSFQATSVPPVENGQLVPTQALQMNPRRHDKKTGRAKGINVAWSNEFNCLSIYSDASSNGCGELQYAKRSGIELQRAFKVPTLRNVADTAPYMHKGQFKNLLDLLKYYNDAPLNGFSHTELEPLGLLPHELHQLEAFLLSLTEMRAPQGVSG